MSQEIKNIQPQEIWSNFYKKKTNTRNAYVVKVLNPEFYEYYQQYSEYKIHSIAPETKYSLEATSKFSFGGTTVRELNPSGKESKWTPGNNGRNDNLQRFNVQLRAFCHYCVLKEGIKEEDVSLSHFTDSKLLERMKIWVQKEAGIGYVLFDSLLHLIKSNCGTRGFLRLCGNKGQRSTEEYFAELDHLLEEIPVWMNQIKEVKNNISKAPVGRKANVIHILRMPVEERIDLFKDIDKNLIEKSESNFQESLFFLKKSRSKKTPDSYRERLFRKSSSFINKAYQQSMTALIFNTSFKICPRLTNWATLNYFDSKLDNIYEVPSLTKVSKNQYQILIPLSGPNLMNLDNNVRYIKNAKFANTVPIDVTLHEKFSPTINQFLKIRKAYIDDYMEYHVDYHLKKLKNNKEVLIKSEGRCIYDASVLQYFFELMAKNLESGKAEDIEYFNKAIKLASIKLQEISTKKPTKKQLRRALNKVEPVLLQKTVLELSPYIIEKSKKELTPEIFELAKKEADKEIEAYANFNKDNVFALFPWVAEPKNYSIISATKILSGSQQESSLAASLERRGFVYNKTTMANLYKSETKNALNILIPELISKGINVHANRHLCAVTYLDLHPGKFGIVAAMINDTVIEVIKTYGNEDRETMMSQLSHVE